MPRGARIVVMVLVGGVVGAMAVTSCSSANGDAASTPTISTPTTVPSTATPTQTRPTGTDDAAAVATAQAYFAAFNEALKTKNSTKFRALSTGACISCNKDAATIDSLAKNHRTVDGGDYVYRLAKVDQVKHVSILTFVGVVVFSNEATVHDQSGKAIDHFDKGAPKTVYVRLHPREGRWLVEGIDK
ncbi:hypothetical protein ACPPVT_01060 [Angustibacter sp. McL0619]|uniref:hypothetical protein n=1 Tax=Angustibacter sp. McL0619 TaxID=3415676 RepID=UPI003CF7C7E2